MNLLCKKIELFEELLINAIRITGPTPKASYLLTIFNTQLSPLSRLSEGEFRHLVRKQKVFVVSRSPYRFTYKRIEHNK